MFPPSPGAAMFQHETKDQAVAAPEAVTIAGDRRVCVRSIAHELNNLLLPILTFGSLLADSLQEEEAKHDLSIMVASARKARELVKALLDESDWFEDSAVPPATGKHGVGHPR